MLGSKGRWCGVLAAAWLLVGCSSFRSAPPGFTSSPAPSPAYSKVLTLGAGAEWRFQPLVVDLNRDGHLDLVATARLASPSLHMWLGDGKGGFSPITPTWTDVGYGALATGDINGDGFPDLVVANHFGGVQTLLSDGRGGVTEKLLRPGERAVGAPPPGLNGGEPLGLRPRGERETG